MSHQDKTGYRYRIGFSQSLSTGIIAFEGVIQFDTPNEYNNFPAQLTALIQQAEYKFRENGYRVASDIAPKIAKEIKA